MHVLAQDLREVALKDFKLDHGGVGLAPRSWKSEVMASYSAGSGRKVGENCRRTRVGIVTHMDLEAKALH